MTAQGNFTREPQHMNKKSCQSVHLVDNYTDGAPIGRIKVSVGEKNKIGYKEALPKSEGYYIFARNNENTDETLNVEADYYFVQLGVSRDDKHKHQDPSIVDFCLKPNSTYPFPKGATLVRGGVAWWEQEENKVGIGGVTVNATIIQPEKKARAMIRTVNDTLIPAINLTYEYDVTNRIKSNDVILVMDADSRYIEYCKVVSPLPSDPTTQPYYLERPLKYSHSTNTKVYVVASSSKLATQTSANGEFVVYVKKIIAYKIFVSLEIVAKNYQSGYCATLADAGKPTSAGVIRLFKK